MKKMPLYLCLLAMLSLTSCGFKTENGGGNDSQWMDSIGDYSDYDEYYSDYDQYYREESAAQPKVVDTKFVEAEIFHVINNYDGTYTEKDAGRTKYITLDFYDDGTIRKRGGDFVGGKVSYSRKPGYEYECNDTGGDVYAFNQDW